MSRRPAAPTQQIESEKAHTAGDQYRAALKRGDEGYREAGAILLLQHDTLKPTHGAWTAWLKKEGISTSHAHRLMAFAKLATSGTFAELCHPEPSPVEEEPEEEIIDEDQEGAEGAEEREEEPFNQEEAEAAWNARFPGAREENQKQLDHVKEVERLLYMIIDLGFKATVSKLHPDRGGPGVNVPLLQAARDALAGFVHQAAGYVARP